MANKTLFARIRGALLPKTDAANSENAPAYALTPRQALAQFAVTGCFTRTFYAEAATQLDSVLELCERVDPEFIARTAIYARRQSYMKDMPAFLCAMLSAHSPKLHQVVFEQVIDNTRMLRTYVQILRSGVVGRRSLGSGPKRLVQNWLASRDEESLFRSSTGNDPSFADILKMVHPRPASPRREAFYAYMLDRPHNSDALPELVAKFERFKAGNEIEIPDLPFTMLSALPLSRKDWIEIARNATWQTTRMNLNTFARHDVFKEGSVTDLIAARLRDPDEISRARVFPYQLLAADRNCDEAVPAVVHNALQDAVEVAVANVPSVDGTVFVCPDVSGSMSSPVTGHRKGATTAMRCIDVAALVAAAIVRKNPQAQVMPFETDVVSINLNPRDSIMTNAAKLAAIGGGGTNCSAPVRRLNKSGSKGDLIIFISDNESWVDQGQGRGTALMNEWQRFRSRNPNARLVCLDVQPNRTTQAIERADILNIGGFSDQVFEVIAAFAAGNLDAGHWTSVIEAIEI